MTNLPPEFSRFDRDPEALAWARGKVQEYIDRLADFEQQAKAKGDHAAATGCAVSRLLAQRHFLGDGGCTIGVFDERMPDFAKATTPVPPGDVTITVTHTPDDAKTIGQQIGRALRRHRRGPEGL